MGGDPLQEISKAVPQEKTHRKPRRIGRECEDAELHIGIKVKSGGDRQPGSDLSDRPSNHRFGGGVLHRIGSPLIHRRIHKQLRDLLISGAGRFCPVDDGCVPEPHPIGGAGEQAVQHRRVGECGILADRRIQSLSILPAVGFVGTCIERDDRSPNRLRPLHSFDTGMQARDRTQLPADKALSSHSAAASLPVGVPCCLYFRHLVEQSAILKLEGDVGPGRQIIKAGL